MSLSQRSKNGTGAFVVREVGRRVRRGRLSRRTAPWAVVLGGIAPRLSWKQGLKTVAA